MASSTSSARSAAIAPGNVTSARSCGVESDTVTPVRKSA
jgi:hypothetical protein